MVFLTDIFRKLTLGAPDFLVTWEQKLGARPGHRVLLEHSLFIGWKKENCKTYNIAKRQALLEVPSSQQEWLPILLFVDNPEKVLFPRSPWD